MTAEPVAEPADAPGTRWPVPPHDGYTVDHLFTLPGLPPHTELIDGSLVFVSPQRDFHSTRDRPSGRWPAPHDPKELKVRCDMTAHG